MFAAREIRVRYVGILERLDYDLHVMKISVGDLVAQTRQRLRAAPFEISPREASLLLRHVLGWSESRVLAYPESLVDEEARRRLDELVERRLKGEPVAHLFGEKEFWGRDFLVDRRVLTPRPETEHLIEAALELNLPPSPRILDLCTGSGCIAVTLALEIDGARVVASDLSLDALDVARANAARHEAAVSFVAADLCEALRLDVFDLVVSNPPYVDPAADLSPEVRDFDPSLALFAENRGRAIIERLLEESAAMRPGVTLLMEIGYDQGDWLAGRCEIRRDYAGLPRLAILRR